MCVSTHQVRAFKLFRFHPPLALFPANLRRRFLYSDQTRERKFIKLARMRRPMGGVAVQEVAKQMEEGELLAAIETVIRVVDSNLHLLVPFSEAPVMSSQ